MVRRSSGSGKDAPGRPGTVEINGSASCFARNTPMTLSIPSPTLRRWRAPRDGMFIYTSAERCRASSHTRSSQRSSCGNLHLVQDAHGCGYPLPRSTTWHRNPFCPLPTVPRCAPCGGPFFYFVLTFDCCRAPSAAMSSDSKYAEYELSAVDGPAQTDVATDAVDMQRMGKKQAFQVFQRIAHPRCACGRALTGLPA